jgi:hypothetical protein
MLSPPAAAVAVSELFLLITDTLITDYLFTATAAPSPFEQRLLRWMER